MHTLDLALVGLYLIAMIAVGALVSRRLTGFRDYFIASGRLTTPLLLCTLVSTYYGLDVLFGGSEVSYQEGLVAFFVYLRPYYLAILVAAFLIARKLRDREFMSLPDVAARYYGNGTRAMIAVASWLYALPLLSIMGMGILLDIVAGIPFAWGVLLGATISVIYTILGGLLADALTDTVQFVLMCVTLGIAAVLALGELGGVTGLEASLPASYFEPTGTYPTWVLIVFAGSALSALIEPAFYQRVFAAVNHRAIVVALGFSALVWAFGSMDEEWGTLIWTVRLGEWALPLWQEYALLFALPASAVAFGVGQWLGRKEAPALSGEHAAGITPEGASQ